MGGVGGVLHDAVGFAGASCKENVQDGWERGTDDLCSRVHCPLEGLAVSSTAVPVPDSDAAGQHTLNGGPVECGEDGWRETCSFQPLSFPLHQNKGTHSNSQCFYVVGIQLDEMEHVSQSPFFYLHLF